MEQIFRLDNKVAVVTGALGRLGPLWVEALLGAGARVVAVDLPQVPEPAAFGDLRANAKETRLVLLRADVCDRHSLEALRARCEDAFGAVDILVNNAGIDQPPGPATTFRLGQFPARQFHDVLATNVTGAFEAAQVFGERMVGAGGGVIINVGSLYASVSPDQRFYTHIECDPPFLKPPAYGASKAALVNLTRYLATHWAPFGVRVNCLSPGGVLGGQDETFRTKFCSRVPMGRMAKAADLYGPLLFLASEASSYITGINLDVDGGFTAW